MTGRSSDQEKSVPFIPKSSIPEQVEEENWLIQVHVENGGGGGGLDVCVVFTESIHIKVKNDRRTRNR